MTAYYNEIDPYAAEWLRNLMRQVIKILNSAHQTAMEQTLKARIPECGEFAGIAQDLDFVVAALRERAGEDAARKMFGGGECAT